jgi:DNA-binding SARP family transcriptional activator
VVASVSAQLRVLGPSQLRRTAGSGARDVHLQAKRLALLTYLAIAARGAWCQRQTLLALFWPERDERQARNALSQAIHDLRRAIGRDAVVSQGRDEIAISPRVWCDAVAVRDAAAADRHEEVLTLYRGPLLDGVDVPDAPEYDRWLGIERERLRAHAAAAASILAQAAQTKGRTNETMRWLRRLLELCPDDEAALRQLMLVRRMAGDPRGALRDYRAFEQRLSMDIDAKPAPETHSLARRIEHDLEGAQTRTVTPDSAAYRPYWRGLLHGTRRTPADLRKSAEWFRKAVACDPGCAQLHAAFAMAEAGLGAAYYDVEAPSRVYPAAKTALLKALAIDPENAETLASLALVRALYDWNWTAADAASARACGLAPDRATVHHVRAVVLAYSGRVDDAIESIASAVRLEPFVLAYQEIRGFYLYLARRYREAVDQMRQTLDVDPRLYLAQLGLGHATGALGDIRGAEAAYTNAMNIVGRRPYPLASLAILFAGTSRASRAGELVNELIACGRSGVYVRPTYLAAVQVALGDRDAAFDYLRRAVEEHDTHLSSVVADPFFDALRGDPRLTHVLQQVGLAAAF